MDANQKTQPHQDPIHQGLRRAPDGLAAVQADVEQLNGRISQVAMIASEGDGILRTSIELLQNQVNALQATVGTLVNNQDRSSSLLAAMETRIEALDSQVRTMYAVLKANKIIPE